MISRLNETKDTHTKINVKALNDFGEQLEKLQTTRQMTLLTQMLNFAGM